MKTKNRLMLLNTAVAVLVIGVAGLIAAGFFVVILGALQNALG